MLALSVIGGIIILLLIGIMAYLTYTVADMRSTMVYVAELNKIIDEINALSYSVHNANQRVTTRVDNAQTSAQSANSNNIYLDERIDGILDSLAATDKSIASVEDATKDNANRIVANTEQIRTDGEIVGSQNTAISSLETAIINIPTATELTDRLAAKEQQFREELDAYVKVEAIGSNFNDLLNSMTTTSLNTSALQISDHEGDGAATIVYDPDGPVGPGISLVSEVGNTTVNLGPGGLMMNGALLKVNTTDPNNAKLQFCSDGLGSSSCQDLISSS
jgi:uncharacterized protein YoxC